MEDKLVPFYHLSSVPYLSSTYKLPKLLHVETTSRRRRVVSSFKGRAS